MEHSTFIWETVKPVYREFSEYIYFTKRPKMDIVRKLLVVLILSTLVEPVSAGNKNDSTKIPPSASFLKLSDTVVPTEKIFIYHGDTLAFERPNLFHNLGGIPSDMWQIAKSPFKRKSLLPLVVIAASSGILIWQDQNILNGVRHFSDQIGLNPDTHYNDVVKLGKTKVLRIPKNLNTALYQLGQGGSSLMLAGGMWIYGKIWNDWRAMDAAYDIAETFVTMGVTTQVLKRISGRESPFQRTISGGKWRPFPSFAKFQNHTSNYDAFPSGHLASLVATITVLANDYPEKKWILPVGCTVAAACSFAMMNTEVHWAGDYPLAIAIGYLSGKITTWRHHKNRPRKNFIQ